MFGKNPSERGLPQAERKPFYPALIVLLVLELLAAGCTQSAVPPTGKPSTPTPALATPTIIPLAVPTATSTPTIYVVQSGDTLSSIAQKYKVTVGAIVKANQIENADRIQPGQKLIIPTEP
ncbi:MAG: LysM peptidoglycan-binding domain-containing protein [Chloroflexi bacterium]|nr:LysM peptidoglycan-binding domain-containing protein [Chloroflexota bacterium]